MMFSGAAESASIMKEQAREKERKEEIERDKRKTEKDVKKDNPVGD